MLLLGLASGASAQEQPWKAAKHISNRISRAELDTIAGRGRAIAAYDAASWHGTDAVLALRPVEGRVRRYVARRRVDGLWEVAFGRLSPDSDTFHVSYRAVQARTESNFFLASVVEPAESDTGYYARAARALDLAAHDLGQVSRPYNTVVLPLPDSGEWYVYLMPAPTRAGYWPLGADTRYHSAATVGRFGASADYTTPSSSTVHPRHEPALGSRRGTIRRCSMTGRRIPMSSWC